MTPTPEAHRLLAGLGCHVTPERVAVVALALDTAHNAAIEAAARHIETRGLAVDLSPSMFTALHPGVVPVLAAEIRSLARPEMPR